MTLLLGAVDAIRQLIPAAIKGEEQLTPQQAALLAQLEDATPTAASRALAIDFRPNDVDSKVMPRHAPTASRGRKKRHRASRHGQA